MTRLTVNGRKRVFRGPPFTRLIDVLRESFGLTGTKEGCSEGECGACTVLVDGEPMLSCLVPVCQVEGRRVETIFVPRKACARNWVWESSSKRCLQVSTKWWVTLAGSSRTVNGAGCSLRELYFRAPKLSSSTKAWDPSIPKTSSP